MYGHFTIFDMDIYGIFGATDKLLLYTILKKDEVCLSRGVLFNIRYGHL